MKGQSMLAHGRVVKQEKIGRRAVPERRLLAQCSALASAEASGAAVNSAVVAAWPAR
jgi:hypothetical protein